MFCICHSFFFFFYYFIFNSDLLADYKDTTDDNLSLGDDLIEPTTIKDLPFSPRKTPVSLEGGLQRTAIKILLLEN